MEAAAANTPKRWKVAVTYLYHNDGAEPDVFEVEELDEIADIIERGPDWRAIADIRITLNRLPDIPGALYRGLMGRGFGIVPMHTLSADQREHIEQRAAEGRF